MPVKTLIIYASTHHGNTRRVAEAMAKAAGADLADALAGPCPDPIGYDLVGLASGVYFHAFHKSIQQYAQTAPFFPGQKVFLAGTCGVGYRDYSSGIRKILEGRGAGVLGSFQCRGYDTYGIFGRLGGIARGRPNDRDLEQASRFARQMLEKAGG